MSIVIGHVGLDIEGGITIDAVDGTAAYPNLGNECRAFQAI